MPNYPNRNTAKERMADRFNELLDVTGLAFDVEGRKRTLYSLRHTALLLRLLEGDNVEILPLARNAGTSPEMLDRFYCSRLEAERKIANLQSFKAQPTLEEASDTSPSAIEKYLEANTLPAD
jgi:hypothetical protein